MSKMPEITSRNDLSDAIRAIGLPDDLEQEFGRVADLVLRGSTNQIRATKPKVSKDNPDTGYAAYVWRMVAFQVSPNGQHQCMPVTANFDLPAYDEDGQWRTAISRDMEKKMDMLVDCIVNCVPRHLHHGINRWGRALGYPMGIGKTL